LTSFVFSFPTFSFFSEILSYHINS
jgi:hypothetical protein